MQWTGLNELREKYLSFFESKGHLRLDSGAAGTPGGRSPLSPPKAGCPAGYGQDPAPAKNYSL